MSKITSGTIVGIEAHRVEVEVEIDRGMVVFSTVGLPAGAVVESRVRVKSALEGCGFPFLQRRVTVNLAPIGAHKDGPSLDLPIALGILVADGKLAPEALADTLVVGELSLDGRVRRIRGVLPMTLMAAREGLKRVVVPADNAVEAADVDSIEVLAATNLEDLVAQLRGEKPLMLCGPTPVPLLPSGDALDMADVRGQVAAKRALEVAAVGGLSVLFVGPPGSGKTSLGRRLPGILPVMTDEERLEVSAVYSAAGLLPAGCALLDNHPFRAPHHTCSAIALYGGGVHLRPGEVTLAHNGVLFLDELPEFRRSTLDVLRAVCHDGHADVNRADGKVRFPADFHLVASMNPCPCGWRGHPRQACTCSTAAVQAYWDRIRPYLNLFDAIVEVQPLGTRELRDASCGDSSAVIRERVVGARERLGRGIRPGSLVGSGIHHTAPVGLIARAIAALEGKSSVEEAHVAEAMGYHRFVEET